MQIPYQELSEESLRAIIEEYITREGTEYGEKEYSLDEKVKQVQRQLQRGEVVINFDGDSETCSLERVG